MRIRLTTRNGESSKTNKLLSNISLREHFDHTFSAEEVGKYKPSKELYILASEKLNFSTSQIALVSSNLWDIAGAQSVGLTVKARRQMKSLM